MNEWDDNTTPLPDFPVPDPVRQMQIDIMNNVDKYNARIVDFVYQADHYVVDTASGALSKAGTVIADTASGAVSVATNTLKNVAYVGAGLIALWAYVELNRGRR